ncbi:hypothetical protein K2173_022738 [Erythroxylum novogranatense]|uniref:CDP-diacylglycerol-glycerol-3-phosphate 3-phosphatidyltransferase n=1 Tax=Erythroxylum novogranatense TaxID=1862640 RepID=A0AAV8SMJ4_9ROSI|nr:hypothetical protein K2173_022738 [Erythroxylum novogranatense]
MAANSSYGTSWADQWDPDDSVSYRSTTTTTTKNSSSTTAKYKQKVGEGLGKTKAVASTGVKKVKEDHKENQMAANSSYDKSWADQWDVDDPVSYRSSSTTTPNKSSSTTAKYKQKVGEGLGKTKAVASTGVKKVKEGTSTGFQWIKEKYHKATQKH